MGVIMGAITYAIPIRFFQNNKNVTIIAIILMALMIAVFIPGVGVVLNGARGWIDIP